jgi:short-subunit dehydrogenase
MRRPVALVTGASQGIGAALAHGLARRGYDLVVVARGVAALEATADELRSAGASAEVLPADLTDPSQLARVELRAAAGVDVLVANAGHGSSGRFADLDIDAESALVQLNIVAVMRLVHAALGPMRAQRSGRILTVSSTASFQPFAGMAAYAASKAFVTSFSEALHEELRGEGVSVTCLCPGYTVTGFQERASLDLSRLPGFMVAQADEVAAAALDGLDKGRALVVPTLPNQIVAASVGLLPRSLVRRAGAVIAGRTVLRGEETR